MPPAEGLPADPAYRRALGGGLVLRWSTPADVDRLVALYEHAFRERADGPSNTAVGGWTRELLGGEHPLLEPGDAALVEEQATGQIVAAIILMRQTWRYAGLVVPVGRPEIVATHPDYRRRGLIRAVFDLIHARSEARGDLAQAIVGIRYFYRQFGYEYAVELAGGRSVYLAAIPPLPAGRSEPYHLRNATEADLPHLLALYQREVAGMLVTADLDADYWRFRLAPPAYGSVEGWRTQLMVDANGRTAGYVLTRHFREGGRQVQVCGLAVAEGVSLVGVMPSVLRALAQQHPPPLPGAAADTPPTRLSFVLGSEHPVYQALGALAPPPYRPSYAWYVRVPDLPAFIRHVAPVLERRLADSVMAGHTGELRIDFYRQDGLRLVFEQGRLTAAEQWRAPEWEPAPQAAFPPLVFLQLLFGHRSRTELRSVFPDAWVGDEVMPLVDALFPRLPSRLWLLD